MPEIVAFCACKKIVLADAVAGEFLKFIGRLLFRVFSFVAGLFFNFFAEIAFAFAFHLRFIPVFTEHRSDEFFVDGVVEQRNPLAEGAGHHAEQ